MMTTAPMKRLSNYIPPVSEILHVAPEAPFMGLSDGEPIALPGSKWYYYDDED